ncbi:MAG: LamG-like jellyroll fold domain-containing protein, partial [Ghiorsea sp.]
GAGLVLATGAATASARRLQGDFSGKETFNRYSTATYIDSLTGLVKTAMPNEMRFERMADGGVGALLEGSSTNYFIHSNYQNTAGLGYSQAARTSGQAILADDGVTMLEGIKTTVANAIDVFVSRGVPVTGGAVGGRTFTWSVKVKGVGVSVGKTARMFHYGSISTPSSTVFTVPAEWTKFSFTHTIPAGEAGATLTHRVDFVDASIDPIAGNDLVYLDEGTIEELPFATSYIPTTTLAVTRAADSLSIPASGNTLQQIGAFVFDVETRDTTANLQYFNENNVLYTNTNGTLKTFDGTLSAITTSSVANGYPHRVVFTWSSTVRRIYIDGVLEAELATNVLPPFGLSPNLLFSTVANIKIKNLRIYDQALTDAEIGAL